MRKNDICLTERPCVSAACAESRVVRVGVRDRKEKTATREGKGKSICRFMLLLRAVPQCQSFARPRTSLHNEHSNPIPLTTTHKNTPLLPLFAPPDTKTTCAIVDHDARKVQYPHPLYQTPPPSSRISVRQRCGQCGQFMKNEEWIHVVNVFSSKARQPERNQKISRSGGLFGLNFGAKKSFRCPLCFFMLRPFSEIPHCCSDSHTLMSL